MSKFGDDLIQSLKEAVDHAKGEGPGAKHAPERPRGSETHESQAESDEDEAFLLSANNSKTSAAQNSYFPTGSSNSNVRHG